MRLEEFRSSTADAMPPAGLTPPLLALWHTARGEWDRAHVIAQDDNGRDAAWVHAHLHRIEGDLWNAGYWYRHAGRPDCRDSLDDEWAAIAETLLASDM